jgi:hypothetical protein
VSDYLRHEHCIDKRSLPERHSLDSLRIDRFVCAERRLGGSIAVINPADFEAETDRVRSAISGMKLPVLTPLVAVLIDLMERCLVAHLSTVADGGIGQYVT